MKTALYGVAHAAFNAAAGWYVWQSGGWSLVLMIPGLVLGMFFYRRLLTF